VLTASGGPFRTWDAARLATATATDALAHPTWSMGAKITIDSATLMNKGLEVIEAHWLYDVPIAAIDVLVHPQSLVHSLVEFVDGIAEGPTGPPRHAHPHPVRTHVACRTPAPRPGSTCWSIPA